MKNISKSSICVLLMIAFLNSCGQSNTTKQIKPSSGNSSNNNSKEMAVGGPCESCDLMFEGMPPVNEIEWQTAIANKSEPGERMELNGTVLMQDGKTPAKNIVLYLYHTNAKGYYAPSDTQTVDKRNGHLRGWVKIDKAGKFKVLSIRPAPYPSRDIPAHIHILVKEPNKTRYYIDEVWFDDDPLVTKQSKDNAEKRGGDLLIHLARTTDNIWTGNLKITLGLNIPGYK